jgi:A/G-specific adenine glycosylase
MHVQSVLEPANDELEQLAAPLDAVPLEVDASVLRRKLMSWYRSHARELPWRGVSDPYRTWVSEVMLQQTRVAAVVEHYERFLRRFPTTVALALAPEADVLAAWSGLGYYRRARMLHKAAQFLTRERGGVLPNTAVELRTLPGIGEYTCAAIASIAFGESIAVVDGNVERVLLRLTGQPESRTAAGRAFVQAQASALVPRRRVVGSINAAGDHNQAMMELGATICLPRNPLCLQCPVLRTCRTRGEHPTAKPKPSVTAEIAFALIQRKRQGLDELLLVQRPATATVMPGMWELPALPQNLDPATPNLDKPLLILRHAIMQTNYRAVVIQSPAKISSLPTSTATQSWIKLADLPNLPLTGLARKILLRLELHRPHKLHN